MTLSFFGLQIVDNNTTAVNGTQRYFAGAWWSARLSTAAAEEGLPKSDIGIYLRASLPPGVIRAASGLVGDAAMGPLIHYEPAVAAASGAGEPTWETWASAPDGTPMKFMYVTSGVDVWGWPCFQFKAAMPDGTPIHRSNFRSAASPIMRDGKMRVRVKVTFVKP